MVRAAAAVWYAELQVRTACSMRTRWCSVEEPCNLWFYLINEDWKLRLRFEDGTKEESKGKMDIMESVNDMGFPAISKCGSVPSLAHSHPTKSAICPESGPSGASRSSTGSLSCSIKALNILHNHLVDVSYEAQVRKHTNCNLTVIGISMTDSERSSGPHEPICMFNVKNLSQFLSTNTQDDLYPRLL